MIENILVAIDGSTPAERAADFAAALALRFGATLTLLYVGGPAAKQIGTFPASRPGLQAPPGFQAPEGEGIEARLATLVQRLQQLGIAKVDTKVMEGPAINVIIGVAESGQPDMLVLGARGWGTWQGPGLGSVSMAVLQRVGCPVLVVK